MVKVLRLDEVPTKIGEAEIVFQDRPRDYNSRLVAYRSGKTLVLDPRANSKFYSILKGEQFLFTANTASNGEGSGRSLFFGGMDESPFLSEIQYPLIEKLMEGEQVFFDSLKPWIIKEWERKLGVKTKRQGDFFAVSPKGKVNFVEFLKRRIPLGTTFKMTIVKDFNLRQTRHKLEGVIAIVDNSMVGEGVITAPDHQPLPLRGPHLIEQAVGFVRPQEAD